MTKNPIIRMAWDSKLIPAVISGPSAYHFRYVKAFADLAMAAERNALYAERGTLLFNPYTGKPRHPADIKSDPHGILMVEPEAPLRAAGRS